MYAIVNIAGKQFKVTPNQYIYAPRMQGEVGDSITFDQILLVDREGQVDVGMPTVKGALVSGTIIDQVKGDKVVVFKKKRRKGYALKKGHRQPYTKIQIANIE